MSHVLLFFSKVFYANVDPRVSVFSDLSLAAHPEPVLILELVLVWLPVKAVVGKFYINVVFICLFKLSLCSDRRL